MGFVTAVVIGFTPDAVTLVEALPTVVTGFVAVVVTAGIMVTENVVGVLEATEGLTEPLTTCVAIVLPPLGLALTISVIVGLAVVVANVVKLLSSRPLSAVPATTSFAAVVVVGISIFDCVVIDVAAVVGNTIVAVTLVTLSLIDSVASGVVFSFKNETTLSLALNSACIKGCLLGLISGGGLPPSDILPDFDFNMLGPG